MPSKQSLDLSRHVDLFADDKMSSSKCEKLVMYVAYADKNKILYKLFLQFIWFALQVSPLIV